MFVHVQICNIVLDLLLFGLVLYKLYDLAYAYLRPWLHEEIHTENRLHLGLIEKDRFLITSQKKAESLIEGQKRLLATIEKNAAAIQRFVVEQQQKEQHELAIITEKINAKRTIQLKNAYLKKECDEVFTTALSQARTELQNHFTQNHGSQHLDIVIDHLPKLHPTRG